MYRLSSMAFGGYGEILHSDGDDRRKQDYPHLGGDLTELPFLSVLRRK